MTSSNVALLCLLYFGTSVISVVTGGASLITVAKDEVLLTATLRTYAVSSNSSAVRRHR
jgi:hypothetical protein